MQGLQRGRAFEEMTSLIFSIKTRSWLWRKVRRVGVREHQSGTAEVVHSPKFVRNLGCNE